MQKSICGILLAAGASKRFGADKLLHPLAAETPVALAALDNLRTAVPRVVAVVRPGADALAQLLAAAGATVVVCADADTGMGASLAAAVRATGDASGWVIALADMPYIRSETVAQVAAALSAGAAIAAPAWRGRRGHPVGLSARFRPQLEALRGDAGARALLQENADLIQLIEVEDPGICRDIDTPADL